MLLNLSSPELHKKLKLQANIAIARTVVVVMCAFVAAFIASSLAGKALLQKQQKSTQLEADRTSLLLNAQGQTSVSETTKRLNAQVAAVQKIQKRYTQWTPLIGAFSKLTPDGITIQSINLSQLSGKLTFEATASTRDAYVAYEKILQASPLFSDVQFPLQTKKTGISFTKSITIVGLPKP